MQFLEDQQGSPELNFPKGSSVQVSGLPTLTPEIILKRCRFVLRKSLSKRLLAVPLSAHMQPSSCTLLSLIREERLCSVTGGFLTRSLQSHPEPEPCVIPGDVSLLLRQVGLHFRALMPLDLVKAPQQTRQL